MIKWSVFFVLLVFAMSGCKRDTPDYSSKRIVVQIDSAGACSVNDKAVDHEQLGVMISDFVEEERLLGRDPKRIFVLVEPDVEAPYAAVLSVEELIRDLNGTVKLSSDRVGEPIDRRPIKELYDEISGMNDRPSVTSDVINELLDQRFWLTAEGVVIVDEKAASEAELVAIAKERLYLYLAAEELLQMMEVSASELTRFELPVEVGTPYRCVRRIEELLSAYYCRLYVKPLPKRDPNYDIGF